MVLWWIGNAILLLVVVPVLVALLNRVLAALERIRARRTSILAGGVALIGELDEVPDLLATTDSDHPRGLGRRGPLRRLRRQAARLRGEDDAMPAVAWVTMVIAALIIAAAALGLVRVIFHLMAIRKTLGAVVGGVQVVADKTRTVPEVLPSVNANLKPVRDFCESI